MCLCISLLLFQQQCKDLVFKNYFLPCLCVSTTIHRMIDWLIDSASDLTASSSSSMQNVYSHDYIQGNHVYHLCSWLDMK
jgi:hypothetical protein